MSPDELHGNTVWVMAKGYVPDEGGMQTYAQGVAEAYADAGAAVTVFTQTSAGPRETRIGQCNIVDIGAGKGPGVPFRFIAAMRAKLSTQKPLFVHGTTWRTSIMPMILKLPYATTFHGREFMYAKGVMLWLMRRVARKARSIFAVSGYSAEQLAPRLNLPKNQIGIAWNGIGFFPDGNDDGRRNTPPLLFSLCRLEPRKNIAACVHACAAMRNNGIDFRYIIAGRGPELERLRELVEHLSLVDRVTVAGFVPVQKAAELYAKADIFLHPQVSADSGRDFEGFGIAIADAMVAGCAVIVGKEGGSAELIEQDVSGVAVDGTDQDAINNAVRDLLSNPTKRASMAESGKKRARALFTWRNHIAVILEQF